MLIPSVFPKNLRHSKTFDKDEFSSVKNLYPKFDPPYLYYGSINHSRSYIEGLWDSYYKYADSNFLGDIKKNFISRFWEMIIYNILKDSKIKVLPHKNSGPDFELSTAYIECVVPTKGNNNDRVKSKEEIRKDDPSKNMFEVPEDEIIQRITSAIENKISQYNAWLSKEKINPNKSFIIAINTSDLEYHEDKWMPFVIKALFGFQHMQIYVNKNPYAQTKTNTPVTYSWRDELTKSNGSKIKVNYFTDSKYSYISGVIFSDSTVHNFVDNNHDCLFVNNPFAKNKLSPTYLKKFKRWIATDDGYIQSGYELPALNII